MAGGLFVLDDQQVRAAHPATTCGLPGGATAPPTPSGEPATSSGKTAAARSLDVHAQAAELASAACHLASASTRVAPSTTAQADADPRRACPPAAGPAGRTSRTGAAALREGRQARPVILDRDVDRAPTSAHTPAETRMCSAPANGIVEEVGEDLGRCTAASTSTGGRSAGTFDVERSRGCRPARDVHRRHHVVQAGRYLQLRAEGPGLDPAHVEQVAETGPCRSGLAVDRLGSSRWSSCSSAPWRLGRASLPAAARMVASGVRRSCETESRSAVLSASLCRDLRRGGITGERIALERPAELIGCEGQEARFLAGRIPSLARAHAPQIARWRVIGHDRDAEEACRTGLPRRRSRRQVVRPDPAGRFVAGAPCERRRHGADRRGRAGGRVGHDPFAGPVERGQPGPDRDRRR